MAGADDQDRKAGPLPAAQLFSAAQALGFPPWLDGPEMATPVNATPWQTCLSAVRRGAALAHRAGWTALLCAAVDALACRKVSAVAALVGGSVLDRDAQPRDLDCVIFYAADAAGGDLGWLGAFQQEQQAAGLDLRLVPADADPLILVRAASFFTTLYAASRSGPVPPRGLVLIDCRC